MHHVVATAEVVRHSQGCAVQRESTTLPGNATCGTGLCNVWYRERVRHAMCGTESEYDMQCV
eukprot:2903841-Rhodomonas_salina.1